MPFDPNHQTVPFNRPAHFNASDYYGYQAVQSGKLGGDGPFNDKCQQWLWLHTVSAHAFMAPSCSHALELAALALNIEAEDEVIMPSFTYPSMANAVVLRGAKIVFVDIAPDTMNIDVTKLESAISPRTKLIIPVHYAGVACAMETILDIAERHGLRVLEDAAQALHIGLHVTRRHQTHLMPQRLDLPRPMMRGGARLHTNQARRLFLEEGQHLSASQLSAENHTTLHINAVDLKNVLRKINTDGDNFVHGWLLFPCGL